jgi:LmbE family N-acetylglucosaminyl deacetylase
VVNELVWNTFRDHVVLEYEIPKWDGGLGQPNVYVPVTDEQAESKVTALLESHRTQAKRDWFNRETFMALLRLRGIECRSPSGYAEAFHARKLRFAGFSDPQRERG